MDLFQLVLLAGISTLCGLLYLILQQTKEMNILTARIYDQVTASKVVLDIIAEPSMTWAREEVEMVDAYYRQAGKGRGKRTMTD